MYEEEEMADRRLGSLEKGRKKGVNQTPPADATAPQISQTDYVFCIFVLIQCISQIIKVL